MASVAKRKWTYNGVEKEAWAVRYFDEKGVRRSKTFDTKKAADAYKRKVEREIEDGVHVATAESRTVADAAKALIEHTHERLVANEVGRGHYVQLEMAMRLYVAPFLGRTLLRNLTADQVTDFVRDLRRRGLAAPTVRSKVTFLRILETFSRRRGWLKTQPVADGLAGAPQPPRVAIDTFTPQEVALLLAESGVRRKHKSARASATLELFVHLGALCGLRSGEIIGMPVSAIDLEARRLTIRQAITRYGEVKGPKSAAGNRFVPIPARLVPIIERWLDERYVPNPQGLLFTGSTGRHIQYDAVNRTWQHLVEACGLPPRHFHALRHFFASWHIANGTPAPDVAKMAGHSHFDMTLRVYTHGLLQDDASLTQADKISGMLKVNDARVPQTLLTC